MYVPPMVPTGTAGATSLAAGWGGQRGRPGGWAGQAGRAGLARGSCLFDDFRSSRFQGLLHSDHGEKQINEHSKIDQTKIYQKNE